MRNNSGAVDGALKDYYLDAARRELNTCTSPLFAKIKQSSNDVWGKEVRAAIEGADLRIKAELKSIYAEVKVPEKLIRAYAGGLSLGLLGQQVEDGLMQAKKEIRKILLDDIIEIFNSDTIYELDRSQSSLLRPVVKHADKIKDALIEDVLDELYYVNGAKTDFIVVSRDVKQKYLEYCEHVHKNLDVMTVANNFKALSFNGIPFVWDSNVPAGTMYLLDTSALTLHQLCDWQWLETEQGRILRKDTTNNQLYIATLVKYCKLASSAPSKQGVIRFEV